MRSKKIYFIDLPLYWYRTNQESITRSFNFKNNLKTVESLEYVCDKYLQLYSDNKNPYYAIVIIHSYFLLCTSACRRFGIRKSMHYIKNYNKKMPKFDLDQLPIEHKIINSKILAFYRNPKVYISTYIIYDRLRNLMNKN